MKDNKPSPLRLTWPRFCLVLLFFLMIFTGMELLGGKATAPLRVPMAFVCLSIVGYSIFRFQALRNQLSRGTLSEEELRSDLNGHFLGPLVLRIVWIVVTLGVLVMLIAFQAHLNVHGV
jgi:hypothetical protein